ncbi:unnamed protein product [Polarella glacialis]|uniref:Uncharacterized protein n=1 Tax=Polarella glacialis TaxID=89957 RepID=A0A813EG11_POLGL|nr:unnamed protein product [Polarella glacialis]
MSSTISSDTQLRQLLETISEAEQREISAEVSHRAKAPTNLLSLIKPRAGGEEMILFEMKKNSCEKTLRKVNGQTFLTNKRAHGQVCRTSLGQISVGSGLQTTARLLT